MVDGVLRSLKPRLARATNLPAPAFTELLRAASTEHVVLEDLAAAYRSFSSEERRALMQAIIRDAHAARLPIVPALETLHSREDDPELREWLAVAIARLEGGSTSSPCLEGYVGHAPGHEVVIVVCSGAHGQADAFGLRRDMHGGKVEYRFSSRAKPAEEGVDVALWTDIPVEPVPRGVAIERLVEMLWQYRRAHGHMPHEARCIVDFIEVNGPCRAVMLARA
jgi:hypothetical protein